MAVMPAVSIERANVSAWMRCAASCRQHAVAPSVACGDGRAMRAAAEMASRGEAKHLLIDGGQK